MKKLSIILIISFLITSCSDDDSSNKQLKLGDSYKGGIIFYILQDGDPNYIEGETHGFIAGEDIEGTFTWGCQNVPVLGRNLGDGENNTLLISSSCPGENASFVCLDNDWFLPNIAELKKMFNNKLLIEAAGSDYYWASNDRYYGTAWAMRFSDGNFTDFAAINIKHKVKPIKSF